MEDPLWSYDAWECADLVRAGEVKAVELLDISLERIGRYDAQINSFALLDPDGARTRALEIDAMIASGEDPGPLAGIPIGVKDLENVEGLPTRRGSMLFETPAEHDSTQVSRLRKAGAVVIGKTTTPEMGSLNYTASPATGTTRNPWNLDRTPGGSSGGSAAAAAAALVPIATGSDGGGSIRIPSSYCGLPGLKVTYGLVPRGPGRLASANLSTYGPLARSVRDIARYLDQVVGHHSMDPFSIPRFVDSYEKAMEHEDLSGKKVLWSSSLGFGMCDEEVEAIAKTAAERFFRLSGAEQVDVAIELPDAGPSWSTAWAIDCYTELESFWPERQDEITPVVALAMKLAETLEPSQVSEGARLRYETLSRINRAFERVDFILSPTTTTTAFGADGPMPGEINGKPIPNPIVGICFTFPFNLSGHPAITIPAGRSESGLPVGLQIAGPRLSDLQLLAAGHLMEVEFPWPKIAPDYSGTVSASGPSPR